MTRRNLRSKRAAHEGTDPDFFFGETGRFRQQRKDTQLCAQVQRAIGAALAADFDDPLLNTLWVVQVEPAPTTSRLMVWLAGPPELAPDRIIERVHRVAGALRSEVAAAIHRKRVPHLSFAVHIAEAEP